MNRSATAAAILAAAIALQGCGDTAEPAANAPQIDFTTDVDIYTVLGIIESLPTDGPPPSDLRIHHEHIPDFIGKTGQVHINRDGVPGMKAMIMDFPILAEDVSLEGLEVGDKIRFTFNVKWLEDDTGVRTPRWLVSSIEPMPDDTTISFDNKTGPIDPQTPAPAPAPDSPKPDVP